MMREIAPAVFGSTTISLGRSGYDEAGTNVHDVDRTSPPSKRAPQSVRIKFAPARCCARNPGVLLFFRIERIDIACFVRKADANAILRICPPPSPRRRPIRSCILSGVLVLFLFGSVLHHHLTFSSPLYTTTPFETSFLRRLSRLVFFLRFSSGIIWYLCIFVRRETEKTSKMVWKQRRLKKEEENIIML